jgi:hypothetical protein
MTAITVDKAYKRSGGPVIDVKVANTANSFTIGSVMSFSSGEAIPAAADAIVVGLVIDSYVHANGDTFVRLDIGGAIALNCVYTSATAAGTAVKISDNQTFLDRSTAEEKHVGIVARVVSTNVADILLSPASAQTGAT